MLIDSHCHLNYPALYDNLDEVINEAKAAGVVAVQVISTSAGEFEHILSIVERYPKFLYCSLGIHPLNVTSAADASMIDKYISSEYVIGIGETGLDYYYTSEIEQQATQRGYFVQHIHYAQASKKPLIIHARDAEADIMRIIEAERKTADFSGVLHCFTGTYSFAKWALDNGFYISASGIITFNNAEELREIFKKIPIDRILIETDSPYLAPVPYRGKTNRPAFVKCVAECIAKIKDMTYEDVCNHTTQNFYTVFTAALSNNANS